MTAVTAGNVSFGFASLEMRSTTNRDARKRKGLELRVKSASIRVWGFEYKVWR
jgi:hypothetical protein